VHVRIIQRLTALALLSALVLAAGLPAAEAGKAGEVRSRSFELLNDGVAAYRRGDFPDAVEKLSLSASMALNSFRAYFYLGLALIGERRYRDALKALEVALDLDPGHVQSLVAQGDALLKLGDLSEARASFYQALKLRPEFPPSLDGLARIEESKADDEEAIRTYLRAIAADRGYAPSYTHLGDLYLRLDRIEEAVRLLEEAVEVRPDYAPGLNRLALAFGRLGLHNEAVATIQKAIELEPNSALHRAALGELQLNQGFILAAEKSFLLALRLDDGLPEAHHGLAEVARRRGMYDLALGQIDLALIDPRTDAPTAQRLEAYREGVERERVLLAALEQRIATDEATPDDYADLAKVYAGRGMWDEAIELQRRAGNGPSQRERLAYMLFQGGRFRDAHEIYGALAGSTGDAVAAANDGVTLALLGDDEAAVAAYRRALETDPGLARTRVYLANALLRLGQREEAIESYREFLDLGFKGEASERVRRILLQIAPELLPPEPLPLEPPPPTREDHKKTKKKGNKGDSVS
jgi:tetratricopeptide (TPR) repeat protein